MHGARTLVELLRERAERFPDKTIYTFLGEAGSEPAEITYGELDRRARSLAVRLATGGRPGDRVLLIYPPGIDFVIAFFAVMYAGMIAVPSYPPTRPRELARLVGVARNARPMCFLTVARVMAECAEARARTYELSCVPWLSTDVDTAANADLWRPCHADADGIAFLQYTSGSTGEPKGVMVSHENILSNEEMIRSAFQHDESSIVVGWLPHFHDMGLIGIVLQPLYVNSRAILMSPSAFIRDPMRWLRAISTYRARTSGGPNFAYELCVRRFKPGVAAGLDLSSWDLAFIGAEPVRAVTVKRFTDTFAPYGFRPQAFFPCYGLAEATLIVTGGPKGRSPILSPAIPAVDRANADAGLLVACGAPVAGASVVVVDPSRKMVCPDDVEGEVWVAGRSVAKGYWQRERESADTFAAAIPGDDRQFLRTGDLAIRRDGQIFITGRIKDLVIVNGQNFHPQDLEAVAEALGRDFGVGAAAAFGFFADGVERTGMVVEVSRHRAQEHGPDLCERVRHVIAQELQLRIDVVVLIPSHALPRTTSGKIERQTTRRAFMAGDLEILSYDSILPDTGQPWPNGPRAHQAEPQLAPTGS
jgi:acyl-CoA synthetase (AMP-forming)/AMP-acid ligase II